MLALQGYYDGNMVRTLEKIHAKKNQKLIITVLDEFMDESDSKDEKNQREGYWLNMQIPAYKRKNNMLGKRR
ncbi:MAG: hypothetical protein ACLROW_16105 [Roseburia faecis]